MKHDGWGGHGTFPDGALTYEQVASLLSALPDPVFVLTESGRYAAIFGGTDQRYYHDGSALINRNVRDVIAQEQADWFIAQIGACLEQQRLLIVEYPLGGGDVDGLDEGGGPAGKIWFEGRVQPLPDLFGGERAVLWVASNITHRYQLENMLRQQSLTDALTGLFNRRHLIDVLEKAFHDFRRYSTPTALFLFDIDGFKQINDGSGHQAGDEVIRTTAALCHQQIRKNDVAARIGGDEFVVLMPHAGQEQALILAERLRRLVGERGWTISVGVSSLVEGDSSGDELLRRADEALYGAKARGRNCVCVS